MKLAGNRQQRQHAKALERRAFTSGAWGEWRINDMPVGIPDGNGWCREIRRVFANDLYAVLVRPMNTTWGKVHHLAIRTASNLEPPWRDKQRIKNELFGPDYTAIEVMPPQSEIIDQADMYHLWVMTPSRKLPFSLFDDRHKIEGSEVDQKEPWKVE